MAIKITTNHHVRELVSDFELTAKERSQFDYLDWERIDEGTDSASFVRYHGELYDLGSFERTCVEGWDGQYLFGYSAGLLFKWVDEYYKIAFFQVTSGE